MSTTRATPLRSRTPLRDLHNEMSTTQQTPTIKSPSLLEKNVAQGKNLCRLSGSIDDCAIITSTVANDSESTDSQDENQGNVILKSFLSTGVEVELSEGCVMSDESVVVGALTLEDCPQTFNMTTVMSEEDAHTDLCDMDKHTDHPYCSHSSDGSSSVNGCREVCSASPTESALSTVSCPTEEVPISEQADITFKSFSCPGGEIEIIDASLAQHEPLHVMEEALLDELQSGHDESKVLDERTTFGLSPICHAEHLYCRYELEPSDRTCTDSVSSCHTVPEALQLSAATVDAVVSGGNHAGCMTNLSLSETSGAERVLADVMWKPLCSSGVEVEIENSCGESEMSALMKNLTVAGDLQSPSGCDVSNDEDGRTEVLSPGSKRDDHLYCHGDACGNDPYLPSVPAMPVISEFRSTPDSQLSCAGSLQSHEAKSPGLVDRVDGSRSLKSVGSRVEILGSEFSAELPEELVPGKEESVCRVLSPLLHGCVSEADTTKVLWHQSDVDHLPSPYSRDATSEGLSALSDPLTSDCPQTAENKTASLDVGKSAQLCSSQSSVSHAADVPSGNCLVEPVVHSGDAGDGALGLSGDHDVEVLRSESLCNRPCEPLSLHSQLKLLSAITLPDPWTPRNLQALSRSVVQGYVEPDLESRLWPDLLDSPIPPPQLNSTALPVTPAHAPPHQPGEAWRDKPLLDLSAVGKGPLQQQLQQMAELLILASGKIAAPATPAPARCHTAGVGTSPVQRHSACVWTTPGLQTDGSTNTSARVEVVKDFHVSDACTSTDSLLWSVNPSSLEPLSRSELEQKLLSTLIVVEVLSQQLASTHASCSRAGSAPSDLRDRLVQTDHTQLSQTGPYRELYANALQKIRALEDDQETLGRLHQSLQMVTDTMNSVRTGTAETLYVLKRVEGVVRDDQDILSKQVSDMKTLYGRCVGTLRKMEQKTKTCLQDRDDMRRNMEEALHEKHTVLQVLEQLRVHHTTQVSELQECLGSQQGLSEALAQTHPQLVGLNRSCVESLDAACVLLREKLEDHALLSEEMFKAQHLLRRTNEVLLKLHQRASTAVEQSRQHQAERDQALEERVQLETELEQSQTSLRDADLHISDLTTQMTIMTSEMAVLREQLVEVEEERAQLQRKSTELSATVSSTLASYTFLEQALASETSKLQRSLHESQETSEKASSLQAALQISQQRVEELVETLAQREAQLTEVNTQMEAQRLQLRRLSQVEAELFSTREMSEFLQAETELSREQLAESENLLRSHLQGLRHRNLECEDLRAALEQLCLETASLQEELESTRAKARSMLLEQGEQLAQATLDASLLHQRVRSITSTTLCEAASTKNSDPPVLGEAAQRPLQTPRQPCSSFLNSVMVALTEEQLCDRAPPAGPASPAGEAEPHGEAEPCEEAEPCDVIGGGANSAFTRVPVAVSQNADVERCSNTLVELLASLGESVSVLHTAIQQLKEQKHCDLHHLQSELHNLQEALRAESDRHAEVEAELQRQVSRLKARADKDAQVLVQDEKALKKLCSEQEETMQAVQKHRAENSELRREGVELRRALQQSQVEVQALREELMRSASQSLASTKDLDDRIRLLKEVERLRVSLTEVEESRSKLLERAKRHQMVHSINQSKLERELHLLDDMIEAVRKTLSSIPEVVKNCPELQKLAEFIG